MNLNDRISEIIKYSNLSLSEFADEIDVQRSTISHISSGRNKPSLDFLMKIKSKFPDLQWDWLINGEGEMLIAHQEKPAVPKPTTTSLPDLFSLIDDENFGYTESEDRISKPNLPDSNISESLPIADKIIDSQRLDQKEINSIPQTFDNQNDKVKRIVLFYESGKFESFEP